jgi:parallel beta-helix repeat protein
MQRSLTFAFALSLASSPFLSACSDDDGGDMADDGDDGGDDGPSACGEIEGTCFELTPSGGDDTEALQTALIDAAEGDVIFLNAGVFEVTLSLSLDVDGVTIRGEGEAESILSFANAGDDQGAEGLLVTADDFTAEDFAVEDTIGDGIKVEGGSRIVFRGVRVEWTGGPDTANGAYGLYPVQCFDVLIEDSSVFGASDAGIYVGQTERVVVRGNTVEENVAGIEIENTFEADVYDNLATANTGGILVFNLPGLQVENGAGTRVYNNEIVANNQTNFAAPGNTVASIPKGTGMVLLAAHQVEVFDNMIADNQTVNIGIISYFLTNDGLPADDPEYDHYPDALYIHDNTFVGGGDMPTDLLGAALSIALDRIDPRPAAVPDIVYDGYYDPDRVDEKTGELLPEFNICIQNNGDADYLDLTFDGFEPKNPLPTFLAPNLDATPRDCAHDPLPEVVLDGVAL